MPWGVVGIVASIVPWSVMLLIATNSITLPCRSVETAAIKGLCCVAVVVAVLGSVADLRRGARVRPVAGLVLALAFAIPSFISEPATVTAFSVPAAVVAFTVAN